MAIPFAKYINIASGVGGGNAIASRCCGLRLLLQVLVG